jgi:lipoprotein signal peptidase
MTKGGAVKSSCLASAGIFSGIWNNVQPRFVDASVTVLTTAIGYQTLFDSSNNNIFNIADSGLIVG